MRRARGRARGGASGPRSAAALLAAAAATALVAAGCGGPEVRRVDTTLGREARITLEREDGEEVELLREPGGAIELPLEPLAEGRLVERIAIAEPGKPELLLALEVWVDPSPEAEDALHFRSSANRQVVRASSAGVAGRYEGVVPLYAEPLELLRDPLGGPWFLPAEGRGVVIVIDPASFAELDRAGLAGRVQVEVAGIRKPLTPLPDRLGAEPLVFLCADPAPKARVRVERAGYAPYASEVDLRERAYTLVAVRLAPERRR